MRKNEWLKISRRLRVVEDFQTVVLVEHLAPLLTYLCGVGLGEDEADVVDEIVDLVASDTVVLFHALHDVVVHLVAHLLVSGFGENGDDEEHQEDGAEDDKFAEAAVKEHLSYALVSFVTLVV